MALSMEEQRILAEIEQELARSEPVLAARLSAFGRPSRGAQRRERGWARSGKAEPGWARSAEAGRTGWRRGRSAGARTALQSPWVLVVASLIALVLLTVVPVAAYALMSLRVGPKGHPAGHPAISAQHHAAPVHPLMSPPK